MNYIDQLFEWTHYKAHEGQIVCDGGRVKFSVTEDDAPYTGQGGYSRAEVNPPDRVNYPIGLMDRGRIKINLGTSREGLLHPTSLVNWHGWNFHDQDKEEFIGVPLAFRAIGYEFSVAAKVPPFDVNGDPTWVEQRKETVPGHSFTVKWEHVWTTAADGYLKVWFEDLLLMDYRGQTCTIRVPYHKFGIYQPQWEQNTQNYVVMWIEDYKRQVRGPQ